MPVLSMRSIHKAYARKTNHMYSREATSYMLETNKVVKTLTLIIKIDNSNREAPTGSAATRIRFRTRASNAIFHARNDHGRPG